MKTKLYKGWKIYKTRSGSNLGLRAICAKHPLRVSKLEAVVNGPDSIAIAHVKRDIDALEISHPTFA